MDLLHEMDALARGKEAVVRALGRGRPRGRRCEVPPARRTFHGQPGEETKRYTGAVGELWAAAPSAMQAFGWGHSRSPMLR